MCQPDEDRPAYPARVMNVEAARRRHGGLADRVLGALWRVDPVADDVVTLLSAQPELRAVFEEVLTRGRAPYEALPEALDRFFGHLEQVPAWVDWSRIDRAGDLFFRTGLAGGIVLGAKSLCQGYCSPGGNKPLVMTGRLDSDAIGMRLAETGRYVAETCKSGGLRRFGQGLIIAARVRLIHAFVRRLLVDSERWKNDAWGAPVNQHDMLGTGILFSLSFIDGVRDFGFDVSAREVDDYLHLWRYASHIMGLEEQLQPQNEAACRALADVILLTQGRPDGDSRRLVDALVLAPRKHAKTADERRRADVQVALGYGFCRRLLGDALADDLALPKTPWRFTIPAVSRIVSRFERLRHRLPFVDERYVAAGDRYWQSVIEQGLAGKKATYTPPTRLKR